MDKVEGYKGNQSEVLLSAGKKQKEQTLKQAGLSTSAANRFEKLAAIPEEEFEQV